MVNTTASKLTSSRLLTQPFVQAHIKENIEAGYRWIFRIKDQ